MKYRILVSATLAVILAACVIGVFKRQTYTDICSEENFLEQLGVAELPETFALADCEQMEETLPNAPFILRVQVMEDVEYLFGTSRQKVRVLEVYAGSGLDIGDNIYLTGRCSVSVLFEPRTIECDFVNIPKVGGDYLVFAEAQIDTLDESIPVYRLYRNSYISPIFCYEDSPHTILPTDGETTYVPYAEVKDNEFFAETEAGFQAWAELKEQMLAAYPMK